ncbi:VWA domain-containing protein [Marinihelvus fidelis]|nr:VWA domain-containing protein [Marinihelvus fidelis]
MNRRSWALAVMACALAPIAQAQNDPMAAVAEQAAVLESAPTLSQGAHDFDAGAMADGAFVWVQAEADGFYTLSLSQPGALVLVSFPNADGRYDGRTKPDRLASAAHLDTAPELGPLLLSTGHPYLLSVSSKTGAATLTVAKTADAPDLSEAPEAGATLTDGDLYFELTSTLELTLPASPSARKVEVIAETRARPDIRLDGVPVPPGGRYPLVTDSALKLRLQPPAGDAPPPRVLVRLGPAPDGLDETEPNEKTANPLTPGQPFRGMLLQNDDDLLSFSLDSPADLALAIDLPAPDARLDVELRRVEGSAATSLWSRAPARGGLASTPLSLAAGNYELLLERRDNAATAAAYTLSLTPGQAARPNQEAEPNDSLAAAQPLTDALRVSGSAAADDIDVYSFVVPDDKPEHLWRVFTVDADRVQLTGADGPVADVRATGRRSTADALALVPGEYFATVRAGGDYLLRVMDLGPRPSDFEGEPNNDANDGQRLVFGSGVRGGFHSKGDIDYYLFRLDGETAIELDIRPPEGGGMDAKLFQGRTQVGARVIFEDGEGAYTFRSLLPAGDWALALRSLEEAIQDTYEVNIKRLPALASNEPDDLPRQATKLPRDGDLAGTVGGFDPADQVFVPLPAGEGQAALLCATPPGSRPARQRLYHWSDDSKVADLREGIALFDYAPELGGAVRLGLDGGESAVDYACSLRFPPGTAAPDGTPLSADENGVMTLAPGQTGRVTLPAEGDDPVLALDLEPGQFGFASCRQPGAEALDPSSRVWVLEDVREPLRETLGDLKPLIAGEAPRLRLSRSYAQRLEGGELPMNIDCTLYTPAELPRPADMGPAAEFVIFETTTGADGEPTTQAGPPPPGLEALLAAEPPERQPEGDLPVTLAIAEPPTLAGFSDAGQQFTASVSVANDSPERQSLDIGFSVPGDGWQIEPASRTAELAPGSKAEITAHVTAPPWISPAQRPQLVVTASAGSAFAADAVAIPVLATSLPLDPVTYWHAPDALRGGLNVLHHGLGARITHWGDEAADDNVQAREAALHDGLAPHTGSVNLPPDVAFKLAVPAEIAGVMVQLRSTVDASRWPTAIEVHAPDGADGWRRVALAALRSNHAPQYLVFDQPVTVDRLRFTFPNENGNNQQVYIQDLQAIVTPGTHPQGLAPINIADPDLGGHVVWANSNFGGSWNSELLVARPERSNSGWPNPRKTRTATATLAFHQDRAARVQSIHWLGDEKDQLRIAAARVDASLEGPNGPWRSLGTLEAPATGDLQSTLTLPSPAWARYLRLTFDLPETGSPVGPDGIRVIEAPGHSVLGLWEDDQPRAAYEAMHDLAPDAAVEPIGGPSRDAAVALPMGQTVASSAVIERNEDWWSFEVPAGQVHGLQLSFERERPEVVAELSTSAGDSVALEQSGAANELQAVLQPGSYHLRVYEPPRSVVITWDTSGSVAHYIPRTLAAVRTWGRSLQPGRDALQLLPFGTEGFLLEDWAETPEALEPALRELPESQSSDSETALVIAAKGLQERQGARGIVVMTDAETSMRSELWPELLKTMPRVVALSVDSDSRANAAVMMDWANINGGRFQRVIGPLGLADGMDMANALFRAPKPYAMTATLEELVEPEGEAELTIQAVAGAPATGAVELILDASGSMLQQMEGRRRIDIAHEALTKLVTDTLPEGTPFAFRAFGLEEDACLTELKIPLAPLDRDAAARVIGAVPAINLAKTAIADSLRAAGNDLAEASEPRVVVLVTDGEETCDGDPEAAIEELRQAGLDARVNIVGFAIDDAALAETFAGWADAGGGSYFDASGAEALQGAIGDALKPRFDIIRTYLDGRQETVGRATLGETITVPAGRLTLAPGSAATGDAVTLQVAPQAQLTLDYAPGQGLSLLEQADE